MTKRKLLLIGGITIGVVGIAIGTVLYLRKSHSSTKKQNVATTERSQIEGIVSEQNKQTKRISDLDVSVKSLDDLKKLDSSDQGLVGLSVAKSAIDNKQNDAASSYIEYLMSKNDNDAIEATKLCYTLASSDAEKTRCSNRAVELMVAQGLLAPGQPLPANFFSPVVEHG